MIGHEPRRRLPGTRGPVRKGTDTGHSALGVMDAIEVPRSVRAVVGQRVGRLTPAARPRREQPFVEYTLPPAPERALA